MTLRACVVSSTSLLVLVACSGPAAERASGIMTTTSGIDAKSSVGASADGALGGSANGGDSRKARAVASSKEELVDPYRGRCPRAMAEIEGKFCIDRFEASLVEVLPNGDERGHSPFDGVGDARVRAVSAPNVFPQGYISAVEAQRACKASGKRLCRVGEWQKACRGPESKPWGYGAAREVGRCNDNGRNPVLSLHGRARGNWTWRTMNEPELNQLERTLSKTAEHSGCTNGYGVYDMVGNLHEWVADPNGTFYGGYYQDVSSKGHGEGCGYLTTAHEARYHDYSTGFRCCADVAGATGPIATTRGSR